MDEEKAKKLLDKLKVDFEEIVANYDEGMKIILNTPNPEVGLTPKETIYEERRLKLYRYKSTAQKKHKTPLLMIPSLINGYYILDLLPDYSLVNFLVKEGFDIYIIDWTEPEYDEKDIPFDYYINGYIDNCVEKIRNLNNIEKLNILGYCIGGNLSMIYTALHPDKVNSYINLAAAIDFEKGGILRKWVDKEVINIDRLVEAFGNIPTDIMDMVFPWIKPSEKFKATAVLLKNPKNTAYARLYKAIMQWREDNVAFPGKFAKRFIIDLYNENQLINKKFKIDNKIVDLQNITCPILNVIGLKDYITPPESTRPFNSVVGSNEKDELVIDGGHLDIVLNINVRQSAWAYLKDWLEKKSS